MISLPNVKEGKPVEGSICFLSKQTKNTGTVLSLPLRSRKNRQTITFYWTTHWCADIRNQSAAGGTMKNGNVKLQPK